ncbi:hypothetical protein [Phocaeicola sp.]
MTLRKVRAYCFIALVIMLFCACQETEHIQGEDSKEVHVELSVSRGASSVTDESATTGEDAINSVRIIIFKHAYLPTGKMDYVCEYNQKIKRNSPNNAWPGQNDATPNKLYCTQAGDRIVFNLGRTITTGNKKVLLLVNEGSYFSTDTFLDPKNGESEGLLGTSCSKVLEEINGKTAGNEPSKTDALFMSSITDTQINNTWGNTAPASLTVNPVARAVAKIDARITATDASLVSNDGWKVTKVTMTNCSNKVTLDGTSTTNSFFEEGNNNKVYTVKEENVALTQGTVTIFDEQYVYENIIATDATDIGSKATKITVTLQKGEAADAEQQQQLTIYVGNGVLLKGTESLPSDADAPAAMSYSVYRNHHYKLDIQASPKNDPTNPATLTTNSTIIPRSNMDNNIQFNVTVTCVEE